MAASAPATAADERVERIASAIASGNYADAEAIAGEFERESARGGSLSDSHLLALDLRVRTLILNGNARNAETLALARLAAGPQDVAGRRIRIQAALNLADALAASPDLDASVRLLEQQLLLLDDASEPGARAELLEHLATVELQADHTERAVTSAERAVNLRRSNAAGAETSLASALLVSALAHQRRGQYGDAGRAVREAESLLAATMPVHPIYAEALSLLSLQVWFEGDLPTAHDLSQQALDLAQRTLRRGHPTTALTLRRLAINKLLLGDIANAHELLEQALSVASNAFPPEHIDTWPYLNDLAEAKRILGHYSEARQLLERGRRISQSQFGQWHDSVATSLHNLALVDAAIGDFERAGREQVLANSIWERVMGVRHPFVAVALAELAEVYRSSGAPQLALPLLRRALSIRQERLGARHPDVARTLTDLASALLALHDVRAAEDAVGKALSIWSRRDLSETIDTADTYRSAGAVHRARGQWRTARQFYERSLTVLENSLGRTHPRFAEAQSELAEVLVRLEQHEEAIAAATDAERSGQAHLRLTVRSLSEQQGLSYASNRPRAIDTLLSEARRSSTGTLAAFEAVIRGRALVLDEMIGRRASPAPHDAATERRSQLATARQRLANLAIRGPGNLTVQQYTELLTSARTRADTLEAELAAESAPFREALSRSKIGVTEVTAHLPADSALVSYVRYRQSQPNGVEPKSAYLAFVLTSAGGLPHVIDLGRTDQVDALVVEWRRLIQNTARPQAATSLPRESSVGAALRRRIWDPVATVIGTSRRVFVVPDGALNLLPFAGLPAGPNRFLIEDGPTLHYLAAERDLVAQVANTTEGRGLITLGGAAFDDASSFARGRRPDGEFTLGRNDGSVQRGFAPCAEIQKLRFDALPGTTREVEAIGRRWQQVLQDSSDRHVDLLTGTSATEGALKARAPGHRVLHIATHGFFLDDECSERPPRTRSVGRLVPAKPTPAGTPRPSRQRAAGSAPPISPLLRAGLALAGANRRATATQDDDDGILTAAEVASMNLEGTEWAVLSACDTGQGATVDGEGVLGLRRAFQVAGVRTVIMSAWAVEDAVTSQWMEALYDARLVQRLETDAAIRAAGLHLLESRRTLGLNVSPFFWAGFVAAGDWH